MRSRAVPRSRSGWLVPECLHKPVVRKRVPYSWVDGSDPTLRLAEDVRGGCPWIPAFKPGRRGCRSWGADAISGDTRLTRASLIVLNYNGARVLGDCLRSLSDACSGDDEIIVVDNASTDGSAALVSDFPAIRLVQRDKNNYIFGLNDGLARANGRWVAFLNNDIVVGPDFVDGSVRRFDAPEVFAVCPRILQIDGKDQGSLTSGCFKRGLWFYRVHDHDPDARETFFAVGGQSFYVREHILRLGSIDELFWPMYHEDLELSLRARQAGFRIRYAPDVVVYHHGSHSTHKVFDRPTLRKFVRQNEFLMAWKLLRISDLVLHHVAWVPLRLLRAVLRGDRPTLRGFAVAASRLPRVHRARKGVSRGMALSEMKRATSATGLGIGTRVVG